MINLKTTLLSSAALLTFATGLSAQELTVWDWKSGDPATFGYFDAAKEAFEAANPGATVNFVVQPHDQYYTLLGTALTSGEGPDVVLVHGGAKTQSRAEALVNLTDKAENFSGVEAFSDEAGNVFALPITIQGFAVYYNKDLYEAAGLDRDAAPSSYEELAAACEAIIAKGDVPCFALGNKQGFGGEFFVSQIATSTFSDEDYAAWVAGELSWTDPKVRQIVELWVDGNERGWFNEGANSIAKFMDEYEMFMRSEAAHTVGLLSDVAHWKQFEEFLGEGNVGVFAYPNPDAEVARLPFGGGIGWAVPKAGENQELAMSLVEILADAERQAIFAVETGALPANTEVDTSKLSSEALARALELMASAPGASPHALLNPAVLEEWKRQSQSLLNGDTTVDAAVEAMEAARKANM
ncbi:MULTISPECIES: ABC transporter substrate-binding protein [Halocynthiibacter]|uniref:Extracellular solute-binding protein n=1 Tax=Halocynthiibacter halioticoli TaxID=2986804 RepID=A0AAE3J1N9_9RHOB|nr:MULTISPECIES: extracellular solute-binding protein [Halocynthiibacter]MCV6825110.1 extracellular solute-binding protein [Halocynthiibacter halioticoli]MCW4058111.1 extracellular solute-binding protein [Halocynthiibacter sp. SDUM655004]